MSSAKRKGEPTARTSTALPEEQLARLKEIFPECFTEGRVDFDTLRETLGEEIDSRHERYSFTWAGKRDAIRLLQTPSRATLVPCPEESVNFEDTSNLFIEGDNLEVLKLLYKSYFGRVKMIYIDPPYNTGNDFIYPDNFADPLDTYLRLTGQKEANGNLLTSNPETSGRYHSAWLSMMYPRLFLARQLLREDGMLYVSIDNNELANLRSLLNEVFGEENFIGTVVVQSNPRGRQLEEHIATAHEYMLIYAKSHESVAFFNAPLTEEQRKTYREEDAGGRKYRLLGLRKRGALSRKADRPNLHYPIYVDPTSGSISVTRKNKKAVEVWPKLSDGTEGVWRWSKGKVDRDKLALETRLVSGRNEWDVFEKDYLESHGVEKTTMYKSLWLDKEMNYEVGKEELKALFGNCPFDAPKPTTLLRRTLRMGTSEDDLILDFFAGSCTTAHAVFELNREDGGNRRFILVQLPEPSPGGSEASKGGYKTIAEVGKERIRRVVQKIQSEHTKKLAFEDREAREDWGFKVFKLGESNYKTWTGVDEKDSEAYGRTMKLYTDPLVPGWKPENVIWEVVIKEGFDLNSSIDKLSEIKGNTVYQVSDPDRRQTFRICLDDALKPATIKALTLGKDDLFICRDKALDDEAAANLALQCRLKTI